MRWQKSDKLYFVFVLCTSDFFSHCTLCRISFTSWWSLLKHKSLNLNLISSPCKYCEVMFIDRQNPKKHKYTSYITLTYLGSQLGKVNGTTRQLIMFFGFYPQLPNLKAHPTAHNLNMSQKKSKSKIIHDIH